jgi:molybdate transport system substrate-binding protein
MTRSLIAALILLLGGTVHAADVLIAVAVDFVAPIQKIVAAFEVQSVHRVKLAIGSTGGFSTQIRNGAPIDVLLAADDETPARLQAEGFAVTGSRFTYARGRLVLWSADPSLVDSAGKVLMEGRFEKVAIANPKATAYGRAAVEAMEHVGLYAKYIPRIVQGENVGQTLQFIASGSAPLGFIPLSQVMQEGKIAKGSAWIVPLTFHAPMRHDAVVLKAGGGNPAAGEFADFLRSEKAHAIIRAYGYEPQ